MTKSNALNMQRFGRSLRPVPGNWITNNPEAARKLRAADRAYEKAFNELVSVSRGTMTLAEKVEAIRKLKETRATAYARVLEQA